MQLGEPESGMRTIVQMKFGSHIYGTQLPSSDLDIKGIYLPEPKEILRELPSAKALSFQELA